MHCVLTASATLRHCHICGEWQLSNNETKHRAIVDTQATAAAQSFIAAQLYIENEMDNSTPRRVLVSQYLISLQQPLTRRSHSTGTQCRLFEDTVPLYSTQQNFVCTVCFGWELAKQSIAQSQTLQIHGLSSHFLQTLETVRRTIILACRLSKPLFISLAWKRQVSWNLQGCPKLQRVSRPHCCSAQ